MRRREQGEALEIRCGEMRDRGRSHGVLQARQGAQRGLAMWKGLRGSGLERDLLLL